MKSSMALWLFFLLSPVVSASNRTVSCGLRRDTIEKVKGVQAAIFCIAYRFSCGRSSSQKWFRLFRSAHARISPREVGGHLLEVSFGASLSQGLLAC